MNMKSLKIKNISRIVAHVIKPKTPTTDAHAVHLSQLLDFKQEENTILINRLQESLTNSKKTFKV